ncbi:bifunctional diguanylate cyclase/phosphodiesterase [Streptomyces sp. HPF1205]|uniref:putative bifunctional diguanylate cyclase/phosphodiesterase n=1 Tax=Streptomyces sp. HPF1205 TaxID=2873262 RepID=UPI001CEC0EBF|nr:diguanylate cyclase [Streptomyces sp. HPF1205]
MSATGAVLAAPKARGARACLLPQLLVALLCGGYTVGAALGWGCGEVSLVMGDFGLAAGSASACVSALLYARRVAGPARPAWVLFALSSAMSALGNSIWGWYEVVLREPVPQPSVADFCFLMFAPPAIIGLLVLAKRPVTRAGWVCLTLDTWLIGGSLLTLSWSLALARTASDDGPSTARTALSLAYPLLDIVLVSMVLALHFRRSAVNRAAVNTAIAALALTVLCDALFTSPLLRAHYRSGQILDAGWFAGSLLMAYAPWAGPRRPQPRRTGATTRKVAGSLTALTPYLAAAVCTLGILYNVITGQKCDRVVLFTGCTVVMALVVRQGIMLLDNIALTQELAQKENHFRSLVQGSSDVIMIAAPTGVLRYVSPAAQGVYGRDPEEMVGTELAAHIHPGDLGRVVHEVRRFLAAPPGEEPATRIECRIRSGHARDRGKDRAGDGATDGAGPAAPPGDEAGWLHVESSVKRYQGGLIFNSRDVTERVRLQAQLQHNASHDPLTDLPNRALFTERVDRALGGRRAGDGRAAVLYVDLDGFKAVNDTIGHQAGDDLLVQAAHRLQAALRAGDTAARLGGDEFAALITGPEGGGTGERQVREIADRLRAVLSEPYPMPGAPGDEMRVGASVGVAFAEPGIGPAELMRRADLAMYRAKQGGKGRVELYAPQPPAEAVRRTERADRLRRALDDGEFTLLHQPVVELSGGRITAVAAQARRRAGHGAPAVPADFSGVQFTAAGLPAVDFRAAESGDAEFAAAELAAAELAAAEPGAEGAREESGRELEPGRLLERAVAQAALRYAAGHRIPVSVRLPARRLLHRDLPPGAFAALLDRHQLPPGGLLLELAGGDPRITHEELAHRLAALRRLGVRIALGGFGAAYGGPAALCRLPVDEIRLDRLLCEGVAESPRLQKITGGLLRIAADLGVRTVAEGVDRPEQVLALRALGCAQGVGMAFSGPLDEHRLRGALSRGRFPVPREAESAARDSPPPGGPARDLVRRETPREQVASRAVPSATRRSNAETPVPPA